MCNPMLGALVAVVVDVPSYAVLTRTVTPIVGSGQWQNSARLRSDALPINGMRPAAVDAAAPKHAPLTFAPSGTRNWSPPV